MPLEKRRLFWISTAADAGKGTFGEYLEDVPGWMPDVFPNMFAEHPGVLNVSSFFTQPEKLAQKYSNAHVGEVPPGILIIDFPKTVETFTKEHLAGLEVLANIGETCSGARYGGHASKIKSHTIVFSNVKPPKDLAHRCVWLLAVGAIDSEEDWTFPYKPRDHAQVAAALVTASAARPLPEALLVPGAGPAPVVNPVAAGSGSVGVPVAATLPPPGFACALM